VKIEADTTTGPFKAWHYYINLEKKAQGGKMREEFKV